MACNHKLVEKSDPKKQQQQQGLTEMMLFEEFKIFGIDAQYTTPEISYINPTFELGLSEMKPSVLSLYRLKTQQKYLRTPGKKFNCCSLIFN